MKNKSTEGSIGKVVVYKSKYIVDHHHHYEITLIRTPQGVKRSTVLVKTPNNKTPFEHINYDI